MRPLVYCQSEYVVAALEAERRIKRGDRQRHCKECGLWHWPEHAHIDGSITERTDG